MEIVLIFLKWPLGLEMRRAALDPEAQETGFSANRASRRKDVRAIIAKRLEKKERARGTNRTPRPATGTQPRWTDASQVAVVQRSQRTDTNREAVDYKP